MDTSDERKQAFLAHLENLLWNRRKITRQQAELCALYARLNGWIRQQARQPKDNQAVPELPANKYHLKEMFGEYPNLGLPTHEVLLAY